MTAGYHYKMTLRLHLARAYKDVPSQFTIAYYLQFPMRLVQPSSSLAQFSIAEVLRAPHFSVILDSLPLQSQLWSSVDVAELIALTMASLNRSFTTLTRTTSIPLFLAPAFARASISLPTTAYFSTSMPRCRASATRKQAGLKAKTAGKPNWSLVHRPKIDRNKRRGVSVIRRTGPRSTRGLWKYPLPVPVARDHRQTNPEYVDTHDHGLWGFFPESRKALMEPDQVSSHGRFSDEATQLQKRA